MANIAYVRTSTVEQHEDRQCEGLKKYNIDKWYIDKCSGKNTNRPQLQAMLNYVREDDTVYIHDFSRLARSTKDLLELVELLNSKGVHLVSNKENLDSRTPTGKLMLTMIAAINEFERTNLLERQREGIAIAKEKGVYKGRKPVEVKEETFIETYSRYQQRQINKSQMAQELNISRPTLDKMIKEYQNKGLITVTNR